MTPPYSTTADFEQTRDFGQKISAVFDFLRAHMRPLLQCIVQYVLPVPLAGFIAAGVAQKLFFPGYQPSGLSAVAMAGSSPGVLLSYIPLLLGHVLLILTVYGYVLTRLATPAAEPVAVARVGQFVRTHLLSTFGAALGLMGVLILGCVLLLIPGFWLSVPASLFFFVKLRENLGFSAALSRAVALTKGHWWETFGLLLMISIIQSVLPGMVQIVGLGLVGAVTALVGVGSLDVPMMTYVWLAVSNTFSLVMYSLVLLASTFQYFHLVEVKEGRGVYALLDQLGKPATAVNAPAEHRYRADEEGEY